MTDYGRPLFLGSTRKATCTWGSLRCCGFHSAFCLSLRLCRSYSSSQSFYSFSFFLWILPVSLCLLPSDLWTQSSTLSFWISIILISLLRICFKLGRWISVEGHALFLRKGLVQLPEPRFGSSPVTSVPGDLMSSSGHPRYLTTHIYIPIHRHMHTLKFQD